MELWPPALYHRYGEAAHADRNLVDEALAQAHRVQRNGLPPVLTLNHLAIHTNTPYATLRRYVERGEDPYRTFRISKRSGGTRLICVPSPPLMAVQRWLATYLLNRAENNVRFSAYAPGSSSIKCASLHCGARWLVKLDIHRFFESVSEIQAYRVFLALGYNPLVSFEMARLCTRRFGKTDRWTLPTWNAHPDKYLGIPAYASRQLGHLPQGAPTSPMLANLAMRDLDRDLTEIADRHGLLYTRYADDITFSTGTRTFTRVDAIRVLDLSQTRLRAEGLLPNKRKTSIVPPGARKVVLGLLVDGVRPRLQREFKERLLVHAHFLERFGPAVHAQRRGFHSVWSMQRHVYGLVGYAKQVEMDFAEAIEARLGRVDWGSLAPRVSE